MVQRCSRTLTTATYSTGPETTALVVREGQLATLELEPLLEQHNRLAVQLAAL